jgi:hypothetical protein
MGIIVYTHNNQLCYESKKNAPDVLANNDSAGRVWFLLQ